jgi:hypothetical protein
MIFGLYVHHIRDFFGYSISGNNNFCLRKMERKFHGIPGKIILKTLNLLTFYSGAR